MKRLAWDELDKWKLRKNHKPLIVRGVRQCGKTWLMKAFGSTYPACAYFNFEGNPRLHAVFDLDLNPDRILRELALLQNKRINLDETLIVFDEIQFCNKALTSLKYFRENRSEASIVAAGSLLGIALSKPLSFPVGQVDFLDLCPMTFTEFLAANGEDLMVETLAEIKAGEAVPASIHPHLLDLLSTYYFVGGMPEAVASWVNNHDPDEGARIQKSILDSYELDFAKHAPDRSYGKLSSIWHAVPAQLALDNKKFIFSHVRAGARGRDLEEALLWLISAGLVYKVPKIEKPGMPLSAYTDDSFFKLYLCDVGLLRAMADLPLTSIKQKDPFFSEFRGALTENFVLTELVAQQINPVFWKSKQAAEVDFVCRIGQQIVPIEVKADENVRSRSLAVYLDKYSPSVAVRLSAQNAGIKPPLYSEPLYLASRLTDWF